MYATLTGTAMKKHSKHRAWLIVITMLATVLPACAANAPPSTPNAVPETKPEAKPETDPVSAKKPVFNFATTDALINAAIERGDVPGAVLAVLHRDKTVYSKAYGHRSVQPAKTPMQLDAIFDLASLTKPIATATSVMILIDRGKIDPKSPVAKYIPEFGRNGKEAITVEHLLLHRGGLIPDNHLNDYKQGIAKSWENIFALAPRTKPGEAFKYTDVGFMVLGELVQRVDGRPLDQFVAEEIAKPLGLTDTSFNPPKSKRDRYAPTEQRDGHWMLGEVHDPRAFLLDGVAGHAGLFSTVDDLSRFARMLMHDGELDGKRILSKRAVRDMVRGRWLPDGTNGRGYGWDVDTAYSSPRGVHLPRGVSFGHTGFTGTSIWIDPVSQTAIILLANRVHPEGKGRTVKLRREVATAVVEELEEVLSRERLGERRGAEVFTGIDVLKRDEFAALKGRKVALITNHTGRDRDGKRSIDLLHESKDVQLQKIFSPEHGLFGVIEGSVGDMVDLKTGVKVFSLYGKTRRPTPAMLEGIDTIVFDIHDIGARFYTYITTLGYAMEEAAKHKVRVVVLDRPNPIAPLGVAGPDAEVDRLSFIAYRPIPVAHGMTIGELAKLFNTHFKINCDLQVIQVEGWHRGQWWDETGLTWINPSPNMRNTTQALLYPGIGLLEACDLSVGRGTDQPFEQLGAPWIDGRKLARDLNAMKLPGVQFVPIEFTPTTSKHKEKKCEGVYIVVTDRKTIRPVEMGMAIAWQLNRSHAGAFDSKSMLRMLASHAAWEQLMAARDVTELRPSWQKDVTSFEAIRKQYLIYPEK